MFTNLPKIWESIIGIGSPPLAAASLYVLSVIPPLGPNKSFSSSVINSYISDGGGAGGCAGSGAGGCGVSGAAGSGAGGYGSCSIF